MRETCVRAAERARSAGPRRGRSSPTTWGRTAADLAEVVRGGGWEAPLRIDAEHLVLAALGAVPLIEVEAEGLPLSLVRAAEAVTRRRRRPPGPPRRTTTSPASLFLAEAAVTATGARCRSRRTPPSGWSRSCSRTGWSRTRCSPSCRISRCSRRPPTPSSRSSAPAGSAELGVSAGVRRRAT